MTNTAAAPAIGTFHAIATRDHGARQRDGHTFVALNRLGDDLVEIQFTDGQWILAVDADLGPVEEAAEADALSA